MILSIVTINYNNLEGLQKTFDSLSKQKLQYASEYEYIVIDGLSTDGSGEEVKNSKIVNKYKIEKDKGIADAFNKGIQLASGEYIYFLNSGDTFYDENSLDNIMTELINNDYDILISKVAMVDKNNKISRIVGKQIDLKKQIYRNYLPHQGMMIKKSLFDNYGNYNKDYRLGMDYEWSLRLLKDRRTLEIKFNDNVVCKMLEGGVSQTRYVGTFIAYHRARKKNNSLNTICSYAVSLFFIVKRSFGLCFRSIVE